MSGPGVWFWSLALESGPGVWPWCLALESGPGVGPGKNDTPQARRKTLRQRLINPPSNSMNCGLCTKVGKRWAVSHNWLIKVNGPWDGVGEERRGREVST